jgi:hypothetical protein
MTGERDDDNGAMRDAFDLDALPVWLEHLRDVILMLSPEERRLLYRSLSVKEVAAGEDPSFRSPPGGVGC